MLSFFVCKIAGGSLMPPLHQKSSSFFPPPNLRDVLCVGDAVRLPCSLFSEQDLYIVSLLSDEQDHVLKLSFLLPLANLQGFFFHGARVRRRCESFCRGLVVMGQTNGTQARQSEQEQGLAKLEEEEHEGRCEDLPMKLPDECLSLIFHRLNAADRNRCALVCKRWLSVEAQGRRLLSLLAQADLAPVLPRLFGRFENVTKLALKCPRATLSMDDTALVLVGRLCRHLRRLKLKGCRQLTDDGLVDFAKVCGPLKKFSCGSCGFGARGLNGLLHHCVLLEDLTLKRLRGLVDIPKEFVGPGTEKIKRLCLKELCSAHLLTPLIAGSKHLKTLVLCRVFGNWDKLLEIVTEHLAELVELHLEKVQVSDRGLLAVAKCRSLQILYLIKAPECGNLGLKALAMGCKSLRKLHMDGCLSGRIGDEGLISLGEKCQELQELVLIGLNITVKSLVVVGVNCSRLERLALCNSETFGDNELACVAYKCNALKKVCIKCCPITDKGLESFTDSCPDLSKLKIKKCKGISAAGATSLQMSREGLVISLDTEIFAPPKEISLSRVSQAGSDTQRMFAATPSSRSALAKAKLALAAGGSYVAGTLMRKASSSGS